MQSNQSQRSKFTPFLTGGSVLAALVLLIDLHGGSHSKRISETCEEVIQPKAVLSRAQLAKLLAVPERDKKAKVQAVLKQPYCRLPSLQVRAGVMAEREVYPLAFDPQTWLVILYEGDEYAGYRLSSR
ncbi:MAG: hypothetical protein VKJ46_07585 [Leptolyngbyaceae bacterium]|nr:hypothetical protein [Leptolyngbyaceae bacterium]